MTTTMHLWRIYSDNLAQPEPTTLEREADARRNGGGLDRPAIVALAADAFHAARIALAYACDCERAPTPDDPRETGFTDEKDAQGRTVPVAYLARDDRPMTPQDRRNVAAREEFFRRILADRTARATKRNTTTTPTTAAQEA